jgi:hypothetical protein
MTGLFALGERRLNPPAWLVKINAVMKGTLDAQEELDGARGEDAKRLAQQKLTRFTASGAAITATNSFDLGGNSNVTITAPSVGVVGVIGG